MLINDELMSMTWLEIEYAWIWLLAYNFDMMNCTCWVKYAKWGIRWVIISLIDVDKWWDYVDDLIRD